MTGPGAGARQQTYLCKDHKGPIPSKRPGSSAGDHKGPRPSQGSREEQRATTRVPAPHKGRGRNSGRPQGSPPLTTLLPPLLYVGMEDGGITHSASSCPDKRVV